MIFYSYVSLPEGITGGARTPKVWGMIFFPLSLGILGEAFEDAENSRLKAGTQAIGVPQLSIWVNFITTSLSSLTGIMVSKGNHPQMALIQVSEIF